FLRERLTKRDDKRVGPRAAERVLQLKLEHVGGDLEAEREVSLNAKGFVVTRTQVLAFSVTQWRVIHQRTRWRRQSIVCIGSGPATWQTDRIAEATWPAAVGVVDQAFSAAAVTPHFWKWEAPPRRVTPRHDRIFGRNIGKRVCIGMRPNS